MGLRSLRMEKEIKLQRARLVQVEVLSSPPFPMIASPPIFLSPSSFDHTFAPSPSPLPAAAGSQHQAVPTAAIVGGGIAGVVTLAATATIISAAVAGKVGGLPCLLGPICKLLSSLVGNITSPCAGRLNSLCNTLNKWNPFSKYQLNNKAAVDDDEARADPDTYLYKVLGGSPTRVTEAVECAADTANSFAKSLLQEVAECHVDQLAGESAHAFLVKSVSDFTESELKKQNEMMMLTVNENIAKAQQSFFTVQENMSDDLRVLKQSTDAHLNEVNKLKADANCVKASAEAITAMWKHPEDAVLAMLEEVRGGDADNEAKSMSIVNESIEVGMRRLEEPVILEEEVVLHRRQGKPHEMTSNRRETADDAEGVLVDDGCRRSGPVCIVETTSDASNTALQVEHEMVGAASGTKNVASVPTYTGGNKTNRSIAKTIVPGHSKAIVDVPRSTLKSTTLSKAKWNQGGFKRGGKRQGKKASNLGHVAFSCEISAHRLHLFTMCRSGGTYGSPPTSPHYNISNRNNHNYYYDDSNIKDSNNYYSIDHPNTANQYHPFYNTSHNSLMHHPSQSNLVQHNIAPPTLIHQKPHLSHSLEVIEDNPPFLKSPPKPSINDYGSPFDGVL